MGGRNEVCSTAPCAIFVSLFLTRFFRSGACINVEGALQPQVQVLDLRRQSHGAAAPAHPGLRAQQQERPHQPHHQHQTGASLVGVVASLCLQGLLRVPAAPLFFAGLLLVGDSPALFRGTDVFAVHPVFFPWDDNEG